MNFKSTFIEETEPNQLILVDIIIDHIALADHHFTNTISCLHFVGAASLGSVLTSFGTHGCPQVDLPGNRGRAGS